MMMMVIKNYYDVYLLILIFNVIDRVEQLVVGLMLVRSIDHSIASLFIACNIHRLVAWDTSGKSSTSSGNTLGK